MESLTKTMEMLPKLDCGVCGYKTCTDFSTAVDTGTDEIKKCIHITDRLESKPISKDSFIQSREIMGMGEKLGWKDSLQRDFDFILDCFPNEPGPKETILPYNPTLVKELGIKKGDVMVGRPMEMSCGCPVTHCGIVSSVDARNGETTGMLQVP